jgi:signal transduction histidine kinase/ligand-binding sensor domain-containing protein
MNFRQLSILLPVLSLAALCTPTAFCAVNIRSDAGGAGYVMDRWQVEDGLPGNTVTSITQTPDGYLWIATFQGLVRFDGLRFTVFDSTTPGIESERATRLFTDRQGTLWVTMEHGQAARYTRGRFIPLTRADGWPGLSVKWIAGSADGSLLVTLGADDFGPRVLLEHRDGRFAQVISNAPAPPSVTTSRGPIGDTVVEVDSAGRRWVVQDRKLGVMDGARWTAWTPPDGGAAPTIARIASSPRGGLWICGDGRIRRLEGDAWSTRSPAYPWPAENTVMELMEDSAGRLWVGSWGKGLMLAHPDGSTEWFTTANGFPSNIPNCVFEDRERNVWVGTTGGGLLRLRPREFQTFGEANGLPPHVPSAVAADTHGDCWLGMTARGVWRLHDGRFAALEVPGIDTKEATVRSLLRTRDGAIWGGLHGNGLFRFLDGAVTAYDRRHGLLHEIAYTLFEDRDGLVWIGGDRGLSRLKDGRFETFSRTNGLSSDLVTAIAQDRTGDIWVGTLGGGLNRLHDGRFETFMRKDGLAHDSVRTLLADPDGTLWIGTAGGGLGRMKDGRFTTYSANAGLPGNEIAAVLDDGLGYLWLASNRGVFRVARADLELFARGERPRVEGTTYLPADGLASIEASSGSPAAVRGDDGRLWFSTLKGVSVIDPRRLKSNPVPPSAVIEDVSLDDAVLFSNGALPSGDVSGPGPVVIPPGAQRLEIHYTGLSLAAPERVRFKHHLSGLENRWEEAGDRRMATYHLLPPGDYLFEVLAANSDGVWSGAPASLHFRVLPAWWQTWWFRVLLAGALLGAIYAAYRARVGALTRARVVQENFSRSLIRSQEAERQRIARELHDSLGQNLLVIKSRVRLAQQQSGNAEKLAEQLAEAAEITSGAIREVREISQNLRPFQLDDLGLSKALGAMIRKVAETSTTRFTTDIVELKGALPPEFEINFYRILQECLNNVVKHAGASECSVTIRRDERRLRTEVADDGRGIVAAPRADDAQGGGFGLRSIRERTRTLGGTVEFVSRPGGGTRVIVIIPLAA